MSRRAAWLPLIVVGAAVPLILPGVGCDSPREIKEATPLTKNDTEPQTPFTPDKAPEKTDPAAAAVVKEAIAAHTGNTPERLNAFRTVAFTRKGYVVGAGGGQLKQTWTVHAAWPDRFRVQAELDNPLTLTIAWGPSGGWQHATGQGKVPLPPQGVNDYRIDVTGEWIGLLFPLAEPEAVVTSAPEETIGGKPVVAVHMWHPNLAAARVAFDKSAKTVAAITYEGRENGRKVTKEISVLSVREFNGVKLPERTVVRSNGNVIAEWMLTAFEPKSQLDPKLFEDP